MSRNFYKLILLLAFIFCSPSLGSNFSASAGDCPDDEYVPNEILLTLLNASSFPAVAQQYNLTLIEQLPNTATYRLSIPNNITPCALSDQMATDPRVDVVSPNSVIRPPDPSGIIYWVGNPTLSKVSAYSYKNQWAIDKINLRQAHAETTGSNTIVAVLDTGIDRNHPAFVGRTILQGYDFISNDNDPKEEYVAGSRAYGHGTHVAGIVLLTAPGTQILPVRVLDGNGVGNSWFLVKALRYVAAFTNNNIHVSAFNMSFTSPIRSDVVESVLHDAVKGRVDGTGLNYDLRIVAVAAAGNNSSNQPHYPAAESVCEREILSIAAGMPNDTLAFFSNYSSPQRCLPTDPLLPWVNLMAPGYRIVSTLPDRMPDDGFPEERYGTWNGTSQAAPFVSGLVALIRSKYSKLKADGVNCRMLSTGVTNSFPNTSPRIDALAAVTATLPACN